MKVGTKINTIIVVHKTDLNNCDMETALSVERSSLRTALSGSGLEAYYVSTVEKNNETISQEIQLVATENLTKAKIRTILQPITTLKILGYE